jgi:hypothetical protein
MLCALLSKTTSDLLTFAINLMRVFIRLIASIVAIEAGDQAAVRGTAKAHLQTSQRHNLKVMHI